MNPTELITLGQALESFRRKQASRTWYTKGNVLDFKEPLGGTKLSTFVCAHKGSGISVGLLGYQDGSLTFFRKETLHNVAMLKKKYPKLFELPGHPYNV